MNNQKFSHIIIIKEGTFFKSLKYVDALMQGCSNSIANALDSLQSFTKPLMCSSDRSYYKVEATPFQH